jgi:hypothetical protein
MTEPPPRSSGIVFLQVLVAALFLAVIGGSVGLALGLRARDQGNTAADPGRTRPGVGSPTTGPTTGLTTSPITGPTADPSANCPDEVGQRAGQGVLAQVLHIQTEDSEVWICRAGDGALYYLGRRFSDGAQQFLSDVRQRGDEYIATNATGQGTTVYRVSRERLVIEDGAGEPEVQPVVGVDG